MVQGHVEYRLAATPPLPRARACLSAAATERTRTPPAPTATVSLHDHAVGVAL